MFFSLQMHLRFCKCKNTQLLRTVRAKQFYIYSFENKSFCFFLQANYTNATFSTHAHTRRKGKKSDAKLHTNYNFKEVYTEVLKKKKEKKILQTKAYTFAVKPVDLGI